MRHAFIAEHQMVFHIRSMCRVFNVHPSGFYAWLKKPLSHRAKEDERQITLLKEAWEESNKIHDYRKLHADLREAGERISLNRTERSARLAGIKAQIGYKRRPGKYGGKPAMVAANHLDRQFELKKPDKAWGEPLERHRSERSWRTTLPTSRPMKAGAICAW